MKFGNKETNFNGDLYLFDGIYKLGSPTANEWRIPGLTLPKDHLPIAIELNNRAYLRVLDAHCNICALVNSTVTHSYTPYGEIISSKKIRQKRKFRILRLDKDVRRHEMVASLRSSIADAKLANGLGSKGVLKTS